MKSSFFELNVAMSGLFVARGNLDTVSHNVANAQTRGYSRQFVEQRASQPITYYNGRGMFGSGAEIYGVGQHRSFYLDKRFWSETPILGEYSTKRSQIDVMERVFNEMSTTGLSSQFNTFFNILEDLTTTSGDTTYRTNLLTSASGIATYFASTYEKLKQQQSDVNSELKTTVDAINSLGTQIANLSKQITTYELDGSKANDLRDQRARLVDQLSGLVNIEVKEIEANLDYAAGKFPEPEDRGKSDKRFIIMINGQELVNSEGVHLLECRQRSATDPVTWQNVGLSVNSEDNIGMYDIYWANSGMEFNMYHPNLGGQLKGLIDLRDGNNGIYAKATTLNSYSGGVLELTIDPNATKADLPASGRIKTVSASGQTVYYDYTDYEFDPATNTAKFRIINPKPSDIAPTAFNNQTITVGSTTDYKGIPYYMNKLNELVRGYVMAINEGKYRDGTQISNVTGHVDGYDLYEQKSNKLLFTYLKPDGTEMQYGDPAFNILDFKASNLRVNSDIIGDNRLLGASQEATGGISDNRVVLSFLRIRTDDSLFREGSILDYINGMNGELGIDGKQARNFEESFTDVVTGIDNQRMSVSGVDINEEMVNMIRYQQQYQACAKLVSVIDGIYDTLVNRLGL